MKLSMFIRKHKQEIIKEWIKFAKDHIEGTDELKQKEVKDHIKTMLESIADDMEQNQTETEQERKSKGKREIQAKESNAAEQHGEQRVDIGFDIVELSSEFRALRASVLRLWKAEKETEKDEDDFQEIIRFNEAVDEAWMISLKRFHHKVDESKNWFLAILGHDLRNPLAAISGVQEILKLSDNLSEKEKEILTRSDSSVKRMLELINNLLELTNLRLGSGLSIRKSTANLEKQAEQIIQEFQVAYPEANLQLNSPGPVQGEWDVVRLNQVLTNLTANALRHGKPGGPVKMTISAEGNKAFLKVHNEGPAIPENIQEMIFTGMFSSNGGENMQENSYGLGLYIVKQIVEGHGGEISLESTESEGTTFKVMLPRH